MNRPQKISLTVLLALLAAGAVGLYLTSGPAPSAPSKKTAGPEGEAPAIDQRYLDAVRDLAVRVTSLEEQQAAKQALDAADHELDLEYAYALQVAATEPVPETTQIRSIQNRITRLRASIQKRQGEVDELKEAAARVNGARHDALEDQLNISEAELNFFQEAMADAKEDLVEAGGDPDSRLQRLKAEHEAASNAADTFKFPPLPSAAPSGSLLAKWSKWRSIRTTEHQIEQAQQAAFAGAAGLARQHDALEKHVAEEQAKRKATTQELTSDQLAVLTAPRGPKRPPEHKPNTAPPSATAAGGPSSTRPESNGLAPVSPALLLIQHLSTDQIRLRLLARRIQAMNDLGSAYTSWESLQGEAGRAALHGILAECLWIVLMMVLAFVLNRLIDRFFDHLSLERKQKTTLEAVFRMSVRLVVVMVILLLIFGKPDQLSTVLGLAGAGLTVVLKDFIVSFLGWFVLMGRHGIRVGDWVEINGVRGEVIEISLLRTVLLETGNWTDIGQPTGRQVSFLNQYAVDGYYFNFTTSGQWLWDELQVLIPAHQNPYPLMEKIQSIVGKETDEQAQLAEQEWQRVSRRYGMKAFSARATVNVRPTDTGVIAVVRYITRAEERTNTRYRLNHEIVKLFHDGEQLVPGAEVLTGANPSGTNQP